MNGKKRRFKTVIGKPMDDITVTLHLHTESMVRIDTLGRRRPE